MLSKIVTRVFRDLGMMFDAIGTATVSFFGMAWATTQIVVILGAGAATAYAAYRHFKLVRDASNVLESVDACCNKWSGEIEAGQKELEARLHNEVRLLRWQLNEALAEPEAVPGAPDAPVDATVGNPVPTVPLELPPSEQQDATSVDTTQPNESATTPSISNPY